jgi:hypothetical protein
VLAEPKKECASAGGILKEDRSDIRVFCNAAGTSVRAALEANFGSWCKEADEGAGESPSSSATEGKMIVVTSR